MQLLLCRSMGGGGCCAGSSSSTVAVLLKNSSCESSSRVIHCSIQAVHRHTINRRCLIWNLMQGGGWSLLAKKLPCGCCLGSFSSMGISWSPIQVPITAEFQWYFCPTKLLAVSLFFKEGRGDVVMGIPMHRMYIPPQPEELPPPSKAAAGGGDWPQTTPSSALTDAENESRVAYS